MSCMLLAAHTDDPSQLGQKLVKKTMDALIRLIEGDEIGMLRCQADVARYVRQAGALERLDQRESFLKACIEALEGENPNHWSPQLKQSDRAYAIFVKTFGIEVFKKALDLVSEMPWSRKQWAKRSNRGLLFPFMTVEEECRAAAKAAVEAYKHAYNCEESEESVALALWELYVSDFDKSKIPLGAGGLVLEVIVSDFGYTVNEFFRGALLF
jgi:hypothetical protein